MNDSAAIYLEALASGLRPDPEMSVSEWSDAFRELSEVDSSEPGKWRTSRTPYLREIMDELSPHRPSTRVAAMMGTQLGKTQTGNNWIGFTIHQSPVPMLMVMPTLDEARKASKQRIAPMIESTPVLRGLVSEAKSRDSSNTVLLKQFRGGALVLAGANSARGLKMLPAARLFCDEVDEYPSDVAGQGDPIRLAEARSSNFPRKKLYLVSTPTIKGFSRIEKELLRSDFRRYHVPCPNCNEFDWIRWENIRWKPGDPDSARLACVHCEHLIEETHKGQMLADGQWIASQVGDGTIGFHLSALYSPIGWKSWSQCVRQFEAALGNPDEHKTWVNTVLAETYEERGTGVEPETLLGRRKKYAAEVPNGVGVLVCSVDVQGDRLEAIVVGYGAQEQSWLIHFEQFHGDPGASDGEVWSLLDDFTRRLWTHESGRKMPIEIVVIDSGGHYTEEVYKYCAARERRRVFAIKGGTETGKPLVGRPSRRNSYGVALFVLCVDTGKGTVMGRLAIGSPSPGYMNLPETVDEEYIAQLTAEKGLRKYIKGRGVVRVWEKTRARNEALDLTVYALAALYILGPTLIRKLPERAARWASDPERAPAPESVEVDPDAPESATPTGVRVAPRRPVQSSWVNRWRR